MINEFLKYSPDQVIFLITKLFNLVFRRMSVPLLTSIPWLTAAEKRYISREAEIRRMPFALLRSIPWLTEPEKRYIFKESAVSRIHTKTSRLIIESF